MSEPYQLPEPRDAEIMPLAQHRERRIQAERDRSRSAIASLLEAMGLTADMAPELEERAYRSGRIWRRSDV
jgi:hypothetical protein